MGLCVVGHLFKKSKVLRPLGKRHWPTRIMLDAEQENGTQSLTFEAQICEKHLDEQHSMAFRGLASPSQARARNMHKAESVVRLFAVRLNLEFTQT